MPKFKTRTLKFFPSSILILGILLAGAVSHSDDNDTRRSMSGVWFTKAPAGWIVQTEAGVFSGETQMRWELEEDANGLIQGFNIWYSGNAAEGLGVGAMCMVGARDGSRVVITEASVTNRLLPTFEFSCKHPKGNRARCLGAGFSDQPPVALQGKMVRVKNPASRDDSLRDLAIDAVRDFCQGLLPEVVEPYQACVDLPHLDESCSPN
jgi:hypothetical protein